jgi:dCTP deaminase
MILAHDGLRRALAEGQIEISPYDETLVGAASIDLRLAAVFRRLLPSNAALDVLPEVDYRSPDITEWLELSEGEAYELGPNETVLGITLEKIRLGPNLVGRLEGRSRFARIGLLIHISAGFIAPGTENHQVLEISNMSPRPLKLHPGTAICQCLFEHTSDPALHRGRYSKQDFDHFRQTP